MSKVIESPVARFSGTVTLPDPMTFPQWMAWRRATDNMQARFSHDQPEAEAEEGEGEKTKPGLTYGQIGGVDEYTLLVIPGICEVVEKWDLGGGFPVNPTPETFPATPRLAVANLVIWLAREIDRVAYEKGDGDPNG